MSDSVSARFALLDKQVVDCNRLPVGRVDDLEISLASKTPRVTALLSGAQALGERLGGGIGAALSRPAARMRAPQAGAGPARIDPALVDQLEPLVILRAPLRELAEIAPLERWLAEHVVGKLPGAGDAPQ